MAMKIVTAQDTIALRFMLGSLIVTSFAAFEGDFCNGRMQHTGAGPANSGRPL